MTENKLKLMLENNELDDLITNKESSQKLCELKTSEEVLDLLKKYDYNETKEVFEQELLEILQNIDLTEDELNSVTGGRISHRQKMAALLGVISLTGAINIPTEAANTKTPISAVKKETIEKKHGKNSTWMAAPREDKFAKALAGIVGVGGVVGIGSLLLYGGYKQLRKNTQKNMSNESPTNLGIMPPSTAPNEQWEGELNRINKIAVSLIQNPIQTYDKLVAGISRDDLMGFALTGLKLWCKNTKEHYNEQLKSITNAEAWNANFGLLLKVRWAVWLLCLKDEKITAEHLQNHVQGRTYDKEQHPDTFGDSFVWTEKYTANTTLPLPKTVDGVDIIWPGTDASYGNVTWAFCSITAALREERQLKTYKDFDLKLGNTLDVYMPDWWTKIPTPGKIPMHQQN